MHLTRTAIAERISHLDRASLDFTVGERHFSHATLHLDYEIQPKTERIHQELKLIAILEQQHSRYEAVVDELGTLLRDMMCELAEAPIEEASGLMVALPTELSTVEVEARIANELKQLKKFHARVRTTDGEATISTLPPAAGISQEELLALIEEIQQRNHQAGYVRLRSEVEREIVSRQQRPPEDPPLAQSTQPGPLSPPPSAPMKRRKKVI
jgi:hypothetical protein